MGCDASKKNLRKEKLSEIKGITKSKLNKNNIWEQKDEVFGNAFVIQDPNTKHHGHDKNNYDHGGEEQFKLAKKISFIKTAHLNKIMQLEEKHMEFKHRNLASLLKVYR